MSPVVLPLASATSVQSPASSGWTATAASPDVQALYRDLQLVIEYVAVTSLSPYSRRLKRHSNVHVEQLARSLRAFGFVQPLLVDERGELVAGHGFLAAARKAGYSHVPVVRLEHLDEAQKRTLRIALNRLAELSGWDEALLALEFQDLLAIETPSLEFDLSITGFALGETGSALADLRKEPEATSVPEPSRDPVSHAGDVWLLGPHQLACGPASDAEVYKSVDAAVLRWEDAAAESARHAETGLTFAEIGQQRRARSVPFTVQTEAPRAVRVRQRALQA